MSASVSMYSEIDQSLSKFFNEIRLSLALDVEKKSEIYDFHFYEEKPAEKAKRYNWKNSDN